MGKNAMPFPLAKNVQKKIHREQWCQHPQFQGNIQKLLNECVFPKEDIPASFHTWLLDSLLQHAFPSLNLPQAIYFKFVNTPPETYKFGELQKAVDIVYNSKPKILSGTAADILNAYHSQACTILRMKTAFEDIISPLREKVIDELILQDAPSIIK